MSSSLKHVVNSIQLELWLREIGGCIDSPVSVYVTSGSALCLKGLKQETKDLDVIIDEKLPLFEQAVFKSGFLCATKDKSLGMYLRSEDRIDIFPGMVGQMLTLSPEMKDRSALHKKYGALSVFVLANEDLFLFKAVAARIIDNLDCIRLLKHGLDNTTILNEIMSQSQDEHWFFWLYEKICSLEEYNALSMPLKEKIFDMVMKHWKHRPSDFLGEINEKYKHFGKLG